MKTIIQIISNSFDTFTVNPIINTKSDVKFSIGDNVKIKLNIFKRVIEKPITTEHGIEHHYHYEPFLNNNDYFKTKITNVEFFVNKDAIITQMIYVCLLDDEIDKIKELIKSDNNFIKQNLDLD